MPAFLKQLERIEILETGRVRAASFTATHPMTPERVATTIRHAERTQWERQPTIASTSDALLLMLDGMLIGENAFTGGWLNNREAIVIGGSNRGNTDDSGDLSDLDISQPFDGHIDEVAFFDRRLSQDQILQMKNKNLLLH